MARLNFMLLMLLVLCALGLVTSQHKARKLYAQFEQETNHIIEQSRKHRKPYVEIGEDDLK